MPIRRTTRLLGSVTALIAGVAGAAEFKPLPGHEYQEFYDPPTPVSGISVVGASLLSGQAPSATDALWVYFKEPFKGQLDLEILSADGRFLGRGAFEGSSNRGEWVSLSVAPAGKRRPRPPDPDQATLAVSAQAADRDTVLVAAWGARPDDLKGQKVRLYVNSRQAPMSVRVNPDPKVPPVKCESLGLTNSVRFDAVCTFPAADLPVDRRVTLVRRAGLQTETQTITLEL
jgi:hypothetical protein